MSDWVGVLRPVVVPGYGGLIRRRHEGGSERDRGQMHAEGAVRRAKWGKNRTDRRGPNRRCHETPTETHETRETVRQARLLHAHAKDQRPILTSMGTG